MRIFSKECPRGSDEEFRFVRTIHGEVEPAAVQYGNDERPAAVMLLGRSLSIEPHWIREWGPLISLEALSRTLATAQEEVTEGREHGTSCPCCGQFVKIYKRKLTADMARFLCLLVVRFLNSGDWVDIKKIDVRGGDYGKLAHWDLVRQKPNDDQAKRTSGLWKPTVLGVAFANGYSGVQSHVFLLNNVVQGFSQSTVYIRDALGEKFDYAQLMRR